MSDSGAQQRCSQISAEHRPVNAVAMMLNGCKGHHIVCLLVTLTVAINSYTAKT